MSSCNASRSATAWPTVRRRGHAPDRAAPRPPHCRPHTLMRRAGLAVARLAMALAPHARTIWIACGPGNNGGDGFEAAAHLRHGAASRSSSRWSGDETKLPADARSVAATRARCRRRLRQRSAAAHQRPRHRRPARHRATRPPAGRPDGCSGCGACTQGPAPVLSVDLPSGLDADTGPCRRAPAGCARRAYHALSLLTLKPGLFTAQRPRRRGRGLVRRPGRADRGTEPPHARLSGAPAQPPRAARQPQGQLRRRRGDRRRAGHGAAPRCWPPRPRCMPARAVYSSALLDQRGRRCWMPRSPN